MYRHSFNIFNSVDSLLAPRSCQSDSEQSSPGWPRIMAAVDDLGAPAKAEPSASGPVAKKMLV